ncbi:MAG TPA: hypothetical protein VFB42_04760 [Gaiellaceae bacterium]|nr:hypothetical protein [Gaiellaceae bacterium]
MIRDQHPLAGRPDPIGRLEARLAARRAEVERREAVLSRLTRLTDLMERERRLSDRRRLVETIEAHLERSRARIEEQIRRFGESGESHVHAFRPVRLHAVGSGYFSQGTYENEDDWWAKQLGGPPKSVAI